MDDEKYNWTMYLPERGEDGRNVCDALGRLTDAYADAVLDVKAAEDAVKAHLRQNFSAETIERAQLRYEEKHKTKK